MLIVNTISVPCLDTLPSFIGDIIMMLGINTFWCVWL